MHNWNRHIQQLIESPHRFWDVEQRMLWWETTIIKASIKEGNNLPPFLVKEIYWTLRNFNTIQSLNRVRLLCPHELQHARSPCPSPTPGVYPNLCPLSQWWHPTISSSVVPFSSCPQSFPASGSFKMSQLFPSGGQSIGVSASASVLPMNTQDWSFLGWTGWISLLSKGLSRVFSNTTVQKHQFFGPQLSL